MSIFGNSNRRILLEQETETAPQTTRPAEERRDIRFFRRPAPQQLDTSLEAARRRRLRREQRMFSAAMLAGIGASALLFFAWLTHVIVCLKAGSWGFLIAGAIFAPIGMVHGIGVWFGAW